MRASSELSGRPTKRSPSSVLAYKHFGGVPSASLALALGCLPAMSLHASMSDFISTASRLYLAGISPAYQQHLDCISIPSRQHFDLHLDALNASQCVSIDLAASASIQRISTASRLIRPFRPQRLATTFRNHFSEPLFGTTFASRLRLNSISTASRLHLDSISPAFRLHLNSISTASQ